MHELSQEEDEEDAQEKHLELNRLAHAPLEVQEELIGDVLDFLESHSSSG